MAKVRIAVIGTGWISQIAFLPAVAQTGNAEVVALVSGNREKAAKLAAFHGIAEVVDYADFDAFAASGRVDAVYIATPNSSHADFAIRAAKAGLHALVEKPLATTLAESRRMIAAAAKAKVWLMTAYRLHNDPGTLQAMNIVKDGTIGEARHFTANFSFQSNPDNHRLKGEHWGGPLQDLGVYSVNAARHVFGENPIAVTAMASHGHNDKRFAETEEGVAVTMQFSRGRMAQFYCGFGTEMTDFYKVLGTKGALLMTNACRFATTRTITVQVGAEDTKIIDVPDTDNFSGMIAYFADCIQQGKRPLADGEEGLADMEAMVAVQKSLATGKTVAVKSAAMGRQLDATMLRRFPPATHRLML